MRWKSHMGQKGPVRFGLVDIRSLALLVVLQVAEVQVSHQHNRDEHLVIHISKVTTLIMYLQFRSLFIQVTT